MKRLKNLLKGNRQDELQGKAPATNEGRPYVKVTEALNPNPVYRAHSVLSLEMSERWP